MSRVAAFEKATLKLEERVDDEPVDDYWARNRLLYLMDLLSRMENRP